MSVLQITTTATEVFFGGNNLDSLNFKNGDSAGTIYLRNKQVKNNIVTTTDYEWSLPAGGTMGLTKRSDGEGIVGPWAAISDDAAGVTLEILPIYQPGSRRN